jgi:glycosidase
MVNAIHNAGMKIIIDWVANYTSPDNIWTKVHPDFYTKDKNGKFAHPTPERTDLVDLNYNNEQLRKTMIESMRFWLTKFDIDGFRCDKAEMVPTNFWIECRQELDKTKPVFMLAEGEKPELHKAFDMTYTWSFYNTMKSIIKGEKKRSDLLAYFAKQKNEYNKNDLRMYFTSNNNENTPNSTEFEAFGDAHKAIAALTATLPGMPLVYSGQESGQTKHLNFFDKDVIDWGNYQNADFYSTLNWAHNSTKSLLPTANMEIIDAKNEYVFVYIRKAGNDETIVIVNLTKENQSLITPINIKGNFRNIIDENNIELIPKSELTLEPYQFFVLQKK